MRKKLKGKAKADFLRKMAAGRKRRAPKKRSNPKKRPGSVVVALANPVKVRSTGQMASKRKTRKKKRANPRRKASASHHPRRRRARANPARRHHGRRRRRNPGMGPVISLLVGAVVGAAGGAIVDYGIERFAGNIPDIAKSGIKVAGAIGACVLGAKHPGMAAGTAAGFLAPEAAKTLHKLIPPPVPQGAALQALYDAQMGAVDDLSMGAVGDYGYGG